jgi:putative transposase
VPQHVLHRQCEHHRHRTRRLWQGASPVNVMLGFKRFRTAATTISGIELRHRIRKGQFNLTKLHLKDTTAPSVWTAVLSAR